MLQLKINNTLIPLPESVIPELNFLLKDVQDFGTKNTSFTRDLVVLITPETDSIFKSLNNTNSIDYNVSKKIQGSLLEDGIPILSGSIKVVDTDSFAYYLQMNSGELSVFDKIGDELIKGNTDTTKDVIFTGDLYSVNYNMSTLRTFFNANPRNDGKGIMFGFIDHSNTINTPDDLTTNYPSIPGLAVRQLFNKIMTDASVQYEFSNDISTAINKMYIPFNGILNSSDYNYGNYFFGDPVGDPSFGHPYYSNGADIQLNNDYSGNPFFGEVSPIGTVRGFIFDYYGQTYNPGYACKIDAVSGGYDSLNGLPWNYHQTDTTFILPMSGTYTIDVSLKIYGRGSVDTIDFSWIAYTPANGIMSKPTFGKLVDALLCPSGVYTYVSETKDLEITDLTRLRFYMESATNPDDPNNSDAHIIFGPDSRVKITLKNSVYNNVNSFDINSLLPLQLKKKDFIDAIFKEFNAYVTIDTITNKLLIQTPDEFFANGETKDWTNKIDKDTLKSHKLKNDQPSEFNFKYLLDTDLFNTDYNSKYGKTFGDLKILNDSEFSIGNTDIQIPLGSTILKTIS